MDKTYQNTFSSNHIPTVEEWHTEIQNILDGNRDNYIQNIGVGGYIEDIYVKYGNNTIIRINFNTAFKLFFNAFFLDTNNIIKNKNDLEYLLDIIIFLKTEGSFVQKKLINILTIIKDTKQNNVTPILNKLIAAVDCTFINYDFSDIKNSTTSSGEETLFKFFVKEILKPLALKNNDKSIIAVTLLAEHNAIEWNKDEILVNNIIFKGEPINFVNEIIKSFIYSRSHLRYKYFFKAVLESNFTSLICSVCNTLVEYGCDVEIESDQFLIIKKNDNILIDVLIEDIGKFPCLNKYSSDQIIIRNAKSEISKIIRKV